MILLALAAMNAAVSTFSSVVRSSSLLNPLRYLFAAPYTSVHLFILILHLHDCIEYKASRRMPCFIYHFIL